MSELPIKQLYEKVEGEYIPFNPQIDLNCILDEFTSRSIAFIFHHYNFFNCEWTDTAELTRAQVPPQLRRRGLWITYDKDLQTKVTERFKGSDLDAAVPEKWADDAYWEQLDFEILLKAAEEAIKNIFYNINKYPELLCLLRKWIKDWLDGNKDDIMEMIKEVLGDDLYDILKNLFLEFAYSPEFQEFVKNILGDMLDDLLAEYFEDIQRTLTDWERVIANALARHEMAITELQNQINS